VFDYFIVDFQNICLQCMHTFRVMHATWLMDGVNDALFNVRQTFPAGDGTKYRSHVIWRQRDSEK